MIRFVHGAHTVRDDVPVVEVYNGEGLVAVIYPAEHGVKIVSRHFAPADDVITVDMKFPPAITVRFAGASPPGRSRFDA